MSLMQAQRGSTLMVALIMLVLLTLIAVSAMNSTTSSIQIVGNAQYRNESSALAQQAIEQMISSNFTISPSSSVTAVDINRDNTDDYTVTVSAPTCTSSVALTNEQLHPLTNSADEKCVSSGQSNFSNIIGVSGVQPTTQSWCYKQTWDIVASAADNRTGVNTNVHQGVFIRVPAGTGCP